MSVRVMSWVFDNAPNDLTPAEMLTLLVLADHANDDGGLAYPSVRTLVRKTRLGERTVRAALKKLRDKNVVHLQMQANGPRPDVYCFPHFRGAGFAGVNSDTGADSAPLTPAKNDMLPLQILPKNPATPIKENHPIEPSNNVPTVDAPFGLWSSFCKATNRDYKKATSKDQGKALREAKTLVADGVTADDVFWCVKYMQTQGWRTGILTFEQVAGTIGPWIQDGRRERDPPPQGSKPREVSFHDTGKKLMAMKEQRNGHDQTVRGAGKRWGPWGYIDEDPVPLLDETAGNGRAQSGGNDPELGTSSGGSIEAGYRVGPQRMGQD